MVTIFDTMAEFDFAKFIKFHLRFFETNGKENQPMIIGDKHYTLYRCNADDYLSMFSPRVIKRLDNYFLIIDEVEEEWIGDYYIQSPSGNLYYLSLTL